MTLTATITETRIRSLDGLRGLAALTVVLGHTRLVVLENTASPLALSWPIRLPLDFIAIMGNHAAWLFFVLSGFVLSRMFLENRVPDYGRYILGRLARLYLPVWGALVIVFVAMLAVPRTVTGLGAWVTGHPAEATVSDFVKDMFLLLGTSGNLSPLWSLQWEVLFSLLLIVYVTLLQKVPVGALFTAFIALAFLGAFVGNTILIYMPMFGLGVCLALSWDRIRRGMARLHRPNTRVRNAVVGFGLLGLIVVLQYASVLMTRLGVSPALSSGLELSISLIALTLLLVVASFHEPTRWFLERRSV